MTETTTGPGADAIAGCDQGDPAHPEWHGQTADIGRARDFHEDLGDEHHAHLVARDGPILLVSFETGPADRTPSADAHPPCADIAEAQGWSHLAVVSAGETWFRAAEVYGFFDRLSDDGVFDRFERVLFYGAASCGYAACAFSVAAPGARVLALQPQATLDPRTTPWDDRFARMRRTPFGDRYGYAPDMLDAAERAFILYDPREPLDAMHASLFRAAAVQRLRLPSMGGALQTDLIALDLLAPLLVAAAEDRLDTLAFARLLRARRGYGPYLRRLLGQLDAAERTGLVRILCRNVTERMRAPRFRRRLNMIESAEGEMELSRGEAAHDNTPPAEGRVASARLETTAQTSTISAP